MAIFFAAFPLRTSSALKMCAQALLEVHPTIVAAVPRFFEKIYANIFEKARRETGIKRSIFEWAMRVATAATPWRAYGRAVSAWTKLQWEIANKLVYSKIRAGLGGRVRIFSSGGAPLAVELAEFYRRDRREHFSGLRTHRNFAGRIREYAKSE